MSLTLARSVETGGRLQGSRKIQADRMDHPRRRLVSSSTIIENTPPSIGTFGHQAKRLPETCSRVKEKGVYCRQDLIKKLIREVKNLSRKPIKGTERMRLVEAATLLQAQLSSPVHWYDTTLRSDQQAGRVLGDGTEGYQSEKAFMYMKQLKDRMFG